MSDGFNRLGRVLEQWRGTPYMRNGSARGLGVDCRYFVVRVLDEMYGIQDPLPPGMPPDTGYHNPRASIAAVRDIVRRYPCRILRRIAPEPGDVILIRPGELRSASHVLITGKNPLQAWHSIEGAGVVCTSVSSLADRIVRVYRTMEKAKW